MMVVVGRGPVKALDGTTAAMARNASIPVVVPIVIIIVLKMGALVVRSEKHGERECRFVSFVRALHAITPCFFDVTTSTHRVVMFGVR